MKELSRIRGHLMTDEKRRLSALMITDMVGYTRLSQRNEALALRLLDEHNGIIRDSVASHGGREVKHTGDGFFVEFPSALQAVSCSIDIQRRLYERNQSISEGERFDVRIGLHIGDVVYRDGDMFGDGVNIASRIEPLALPGGVCLSQSVQAQVWNKIDRPLKSLGSKELKNVDLPMEVFRVVLPWEKKEDEKSKPQKLDRNRLAVLPLVNISRSPDDAYFADGMTEELIYTLSKISGLRVIAQTSVMGYKGTTKAAREIGRELKVGSILEGSVRKAGDRVRITVQLIDVRSEEHVWSERYDRELADVFEIQSEISMEVAKGLKVFIKAASLSGAVEKPTERLDAYTEYLKGRQFWARRTRTGLLKALEHFELAIAADPKFAEAYSGLADCYTVLANQGHEPAHAVLPKAKDAAKKALELDPDLAEAHASLGIVYLQFKEDAPAAEKEFAKAIARNPSYATARQWYSGALRAQMRYEEALGHAEKAIELDPLAHIMHVNAASILSELGRFEDAKAHLRRAIDLEPDFEESWSDLAEADMALWNWCGAEATLDTALERNPNNGSALSRKGLLLQVLGHRDEAETLLRKAVAVAPESPLVQMRVATWNRFTGRFDEAIRVYEQFYRRQTTDPWAQVMLAVTYLENGQPDEALEWIERAEGAHEKVLPKYRFLFSAVRGQIAAVQGDEQEARSCIDQIGAYKQDLRRHSAQAAIYLALGESDRAFELLEEALAVHDPRLADLPVSPVMVPYHGDPRYQRMLEVMGLAKVAKTA
jgi:adenylate cyclase